MVETMLKGWSKVAMVETKLKELNQSCKGWHTVEKG